MLRMQSGAWPFIAGRPRTVQDQLAYPGRIAIFSCAAILALMLLIHPCHHPEPCAPMPKSFFVLPRQALIGPLLPALLLSACASLDGEGKIYAGRDLRYPGDTNTNYDPTGHALICVLGNFEVQTPNEKQLRAVVELMAWLCASHQLPPEVIAGHKDVAQGTVCPGKNLYAYLANGYFQQEAGKRLQR